MTERSPGPISLNRYELELAWQGIPTFMKLPVCLTPDDLRAGGVDVAVGGAPWDGTALTRAGTHMGPQAIRTCDHLPAPPYGRPHLHVRVDPFEHLTVCDYGDAGSSSAARTAPSRTSARSWPRSSRAVPSR